MDEKKSINDFVHNLRRVAKNPEHLSEFELLDRFEFLISDITYDKGFTLDMLKELLSVIYHVSYSNENDLRLRLTKRRNRSIDEILEGIKIWAELNKQ